MAGFDDRWLDYELPSIANLDYQAMLRAAADERARQQMLAQPAQAPVSVSGGPGAGWEEYDPTTRDRWSDYASQLATAAGAGPIAGDRARQTFQDWADFLPFVGTGLGAAETGEAYDRGDYLGAGVEGLLTAASVIPGAGGAARAAMKGAKRATQTPTQAIQVRRGEGPGGTWAGEVSKNKYARPQEEWVAEYETLYDLAPKKPMKLEDLVGSYLFAAPGDRSDIAKRVLSLNGDRLEIPTDLHGGHNFGVGLAGQGPDKSVWASKSDVIDKFVTRMEMARRSGRLPEDAPINLMFSPMGGPAVDYSHMPASIAIDQLTRRSISPDDMDAFDAAVRKHDKGKKWPGLRNPNLRDILMQDTSGPARTAMMEVMDSVRWRNKGFPDVGPIRWAVTDPELLDVPIGTMGTSVMRLDPSGRVIPREAQAYQHPTYDTQIAGTGEVGRLEQLLPREVLFPDFYDDPYHQAMTTSARNNTFNFKHHFQAADEEWFDRAMAFMRSDAGKRLGLAGAVTAGIITLDQMRIIQDMYDNSDQPPGVI